MENGLLTIKEYADIKGVSVQSVYKRVKAGLKEYCVEIDGKKYIRAEVLEQPEPEQQRETDEQPEPEKVYTADYVELLLEQIADLKQDKAYLQQALDQQQQLSLLDKQEIAQLQERLALTAGQTEPEQQEEKEQEQPEPKPQPEKKKGFLARLFGGNS